MSSVLTSRKNTVIGTAVKIIRKLGSKPVTPEAIVERAIRAGLVRVPNGRTKSYVIQIFQSTLYNNAFYSKKPVIKRTTRGKYTTKATIR
jgi:hypothetical protein